MSIHLYKHNEDAYRAVETMLEEKQMAAVIHPTGTGKSMIAFKLVEQWSSIRTSTFYGYHQVSTSTRHSLRT
jgi:superfamily II DNA or RNA helicase